MNDSYGQNSKTAITRKRPLLILKQLQLELGTLRRNKRVASKIQILFAVIFLRNVVGSGRK